MSFPMANSLAFGERRRPHPLALFGVTALASLALIGFGGAFLAGSITEVAGNVPPPKTARQAWYVPATNSGRLFVAKDLDIARAFPVEPKLETVALQQDIGFGTHTVSVESLRVRSGPSKISDQVFSLKGGTSVAVEKSDRGWVEIATEDGRQGWVYGTLLAPIGGAAPPR